MLSMLLLTQVGVLFRDDFGGSNLDESKWAVANWKLGRTQFGSKPSLAKGIATLKHETFYSKAPGELFSGTEIFTKAAFDLGTGLEIEARVRVNRMPPGIVASLFTYATDRVGTDEIDFEFLTTQINRATINRATKDHPVLMTNWNDWEEAKELYGNQRNHSPAQVPVKGLDMQKFNLFTIRWLPTRTEWLVNGVLVRTCRDAVPTAASPVRLNFWAAAKSWTEAFSGDYLPTADAKMNQIARYDVDYVQVKRIH